MLESHEMEELLQLLGDGGGADGTKSTQDDGREDARDGVAASASRRVGRGRLGSMESAGRDAATAVSSVQDEAERDEADTIGVALVSERLGGPRLQYEVQADRDRDRDKSIVVSSTGDASKQ